MELLEQELDGDIRWEIGLVYYVLHSALCHYISTQKNKP